MGKKAKFTIGKIWSGHFWYTNFWAPGPPRPPPFNTSLPGGRRTRQAGTEPYPFVCVWGGGAQMGTCAGRMLYCAGSVASACVCYGVLHGCASMLCCAVAMMCCTARARARARVCGRACVPARVSLLSASGFICERVAATGPPHQPQLLCLCTAERRPWALDMLLAVCLIIQLTRIF